MAITVKQTSETHQAPATWTGIIQDLAKNPNIGQIGFQYFFKKIGHKKVNASHFNYSIDSLFASMLAGDDQWIKEAVIGLRETAVFIDTSRGSFITRTFQPNFAVIAGALVAELVGAENWSEFKPKAFRRLSKLHNCFDFQTARSVWAALCYSEMKLAGKLLKLRVQSGSHDSLKQLKRHQTKLFKASQSQSPTTLRKTWIAYLEQFPELRRLGLASWSDLFLAAKFVYISCGDEALVKLNECLIQDIIRFSNVFQH